MARSDVENTAAIAGVLGLGVQFGLILPHSRSHELHAGELGVDYMVKAGCDSQHAVRFGSA